MPITVCMILQSFYPVLGGAQRQVQSLAPLLATGGVRPIILTRQPGGQPPREEINGLQAYRIPVFGSGACASLTFTLGALRFLIVHRHEVDIYHAFDLLSPSTVGVCADLLFGAPLVVKILRGGSYGDLDRLRHKMLGGQRLRLLRRTVDRFIAISEEIRSELIAAGIPQEHIVSIPNGVDVKRFHPLGDQAREALRQRLGLGKGLIIAFSGRLEVEKNVSRLINTWPALTADGIDAEFVILGGGSQQAALYSQAKALGAATHFTGVVDDVVPWLQAADVFVLPSTTEGLSNAMLEAMAVGLPCVVSAVGGARDVIISGQNGFLIDPNSMGEDQLAVALLALAHDPELGRKIGTSARETIIEHFSLERTARDLISLYSCLADSIGDAPQMVDKTNRKRGQDNYAGGKGEAACRTPDTTAVDR